MRRVDVTTENGTVYRLCEVGDAWLWEKVAKTARSGSTRSDRGILEHWPSPVIGSSMVLRTQPLEAGGSRTILTSYVVEIRECE